jgi:hypothetical protein
VFGKKAGSVINLKFVFVLSCSWLRENDSFYLSASSPSPKTLANSLIKNPQKLKRKIAV